MPADIGRSKKKLVADLIHAWAVFNKQKSQELSKFVEHSGLLYVTVNTCETHTLYSHRLDCEV